MNNLTITVLLFLIFNTIAIGIARFIWLKTYEGKVISLIGGYISAIVLCLMFLCFYLIVSIQ